MKVECTRDKLAHAIAGAEKITGKNLTLPVLGCILIEAKNNQLIVRSTNLDLGIEITVPVKVDEEGIIAVPGGILSSFISQIQSKNVMLETVEGNLKVSTPQNSTVIKSMLHEDFPKIPVIEDGKSFSIAAQQFVQGLQSVWYSSSTSSMKPELSSVYVYADGDEAVFVATDSFRLAEKRIPLKNSKEFPSILIPHRNVLEIIRTLEGSKDEVQVKMNKNQISFAFEGIYLTSRIVDGVFPDYRQIIPKEFKTETIVLKADFQQALKIANIFSDAFKQVNVKVDPSKKIFELKTRNSDVGENVNRIDGALSGDPIEINFNYKYIVDSFQSLNSDSIALQFAALNRPMIMKGVSDSSFTYLVMPMNK